jgi:hypothetical protein
MFECWRWDDHYVYHSVDHALDGSLAGESYAFSDGRWLPRYVGDGETWQQDIRNNYITWYDRTCVASRGINAGMPGSGLFPYQLRAELVGDTLTLTYAPYAPGQSPSSLETFTFKRGMGWVRWESQRGVATFEQIGGISVGFVGSRCAQP